MRSFFILLFHGDLFYFLVIVFTSLTVISLVTSLLLQSLFALMLECGVVLFGNLLRSLKITCSNSLSNI